MRMLGLVMVFFLILVSGCASTPELSNEARAAIFGVTINQDISKSKMFYQGPGSGAFAIFGVVGGLASVAANSSPGEILSKYAEDNGIFIEKIVAEELANALQEKHKIPLLSAPDKNSGVIDIQVYHYGFSIAHGLSSKLYPALGIKVSMRDKSGKELWSARDSIMPISSDVAALELEQIRSNPQLMESAWRQTAKVIATNIVDGM